MNEEKKYFAFISYSHKDKDAAKKLQNFIQGYKIPAKLEDRPDLPKRIGRVFRDEDELVGDELTPQIEEALRQSRYLIVVCSPNSAKSKYVDEEIEYFKSLGGETKILPYIIAGKATTDEDPDCCYAPALRENQKKHQIVGGDAQENGAEAASVKLIAGMLKLEFNTLYDRFRKAEKRKRNIVITAITAFALLMAGVTAWILFLYKDVQESKSVILAENAMNKIEKGDYLGARRTALEAITLSYSPEAEAALRQSWESNSGTLEGHSKCVYSVTWSLDGKYLASGSWDGTVIIWDANSGEIIKSLKEHSDGVNSVSWSPDGKYLASGSWDNTVIIWDANSGEIIKSLKEHSDGVNSVSWSPDGKYLASGSKDKNVIIWDARSGEKLKTLQGHFNNVSLVSWSIDGKCLLIGSENKLVEMWNVNSFKVFDTLEVNSEKLRSICWSPDGKYFANITGDKSVIIWDAKSGEKFKTLAGHSSMVNSVSWSTDGKYLACGLFDGNIRLWKLCKDKKYSKLEEMPLNLYSSKLSPDKKFLAEDSWLVGFKIRDAKSGEEIQTLKGYSDFVTSVTWSPNGKYLVGVSGNIIVKVWDAESGLCLQTFEGHNASVTFVGFTSDGRKIISKDIDGKILSWNFPPLDELIEKTKKWAEK